MEIEVSFKDYIPNLYSMYRLIGLIKDNNYKKGKQLKTSNKDHKVIQPEVKTPKEQKSPEKIDPACYFL